MKKIVVAIAAGLVAIIASHLLWPSPTQQGARSAKETQAAAPTPSAPTQAAPAPAATPVPATPSAEASGAPSDGPYTGTPAARAEWEPVVQGFALAYTNTSGQTRKEWLRQLRPLLSREVLDELRHTDLSKVPVGRYAGYQVLKQADESLTVRIIYQEGWGIVAYVVAEGDPHYLVDRFDLALEFD